MSDVKVWVAQENDYPLFEKLFHGHPEVPSTYAERDKLLAKNLKKQQTPSSIDKVHIDCKQYLLWCATEGKAPNDFETLLSFISQKSI